MTVLGKMFTKIKCPICKRNYLTVYSNGEKYCPHCGLITVEAKQSVVDEKREKP
jgi:uncharacterized Zn finger protein (UPF0148 family)